MFNSRYTLENNIPNSVISNKEIESIENLYFAKTTPTFDLQPISNLLYEPVNGDVYFDATQYPYRNYYNFIHGSVYKNYVIPTNSYMFNIENNAVTVENIDKKISLTEYVDKVDQLTRDNITKIYSTHDHVILSYSGGIDSMVLLSYIMAGNFLPQTTIIYHTNLVQHSDHKAQVNNDPDKIVALEDTLNLISSLGADVIKINVTEQDLINIFNTRDYFHCRFYSTSTAMALFKNSPILYGHRGNQVLLHKDIFIDQLLLEGYIGEKEVVERINKQDFYTSTLSQYDVNRERTPLDYHWLGRNFWEELNGFQGNTIESPLFNEQTKLCRKLDFSTVDLDVILDVKVGRELIERNVGTMLNNYIIREGLGDADVTVYKMFKRELFDDAIFNIPNNINHDLNGLKWLKTNLNNEFISTFNLLSLKALQHLSSLHNKFGWKK